MSSSRGSSPPSKRKKQEHQSNSHSDSAQWLNQNFVVPPQFLPNYVIPTVAMMPPGVFPPQYPPPNWSYPQPPVNPHYPLYIAPQFSNQPPNVYQQLPINLPPVPPNRPQSAPAIYSNNSYNRERVSEHREAKSPDRNQRDYRDQDRPSSREHYRDRDRPSSRDSRDYRDKDRPVSRDGRDRSNRERDHKEETRERERDRDHRDRDYKENREHKERDHRDRERERDERDREHRDSRESRDNNRPSSRGRERRNDESSFKAPTWHKNKPYGFKKYKDKVYIFNKQVIYDTIYRHSFVGETFHPKCGKDAAQHLYAYKIVITPILTSQSPTVINFQNEDYYFEGFLILSHHPFDVPSVSFSRTGVEHTAAFQRTEVPADLDIELLEEFHRLFFDKILQVKQWSNDPTEEKTAKEQKASPCRRFHFYPLFSTQTFLPDPNAIDLALEEQPAQVPASSSTPKTLLLAQVLKHMRDSNTNVLSILKLFDLHKPEEVQKALKRVQDYVCVTDYPGPAYRIDDFDLLGTVDEKYESPAGWMSYYDYLRSVGCHVRYVRQPLLYHKNMGAVEQGVRDAPHVKLVPEFSRITGLKTDICLMGILLPTMSYHIRLFCSLAELEKRVNVRFHDKRLLRKAFTHPSYSEIYFAHVGEIKAAHGRVGDYLKVSSASDIEVNLNAAANITPLGNRMKLKGFQKLFSMANNQNMESVSSESVGELFSYITHNERLEFLGDAVLEFIVTSHLTLQFPHLKEGDLATYRTLLINNRFLSHLFQQMQLQPFVLYAASKDLTEEGDAREHMFADCFEALIGAIYIDQGLQACRQFYAQCLFHSDKDLLQMWMAPKKHILQDSSADNSFLENSSTVAKFRSFEEQTGYRFRSIKLLIQAFTHPSVSKSFDALDIGTNAILEFLGDAVLQFLTSRHLFTHYPHFQEGKLTLMRSSLVNNQTISDVADEVGIGEFMRYFPADLNSSQPNMLEKDSKNFSFMMANAFEAFLGALYLDRNLEVAETFLRVALFPRLTNAVTSQDWLDPKTKLSRLVFTVTKDKQFAPSYRLVREMGPPHMRQFVVAVYFSGEEIGRGEGYSKHSAEQEAAQQAIRVIKNMFPQAVHRNT